MLNSDHHIIFLSYVDGTVLAQSEAFVSVYQQKINLFLPNASS